MAEFPPGRGRLSRCVAARSAARMGLLFDAQDGRSDCPAQPRASCAGSPTTHSGLSSLSLHAERRQFARAGRILSAPHARRAVQEPVRALSSALRRHEYLSRSPALHVAERSARIFAGSAKRRLVWIVSSVLWKFARSSLQSGLQGWSSLQQVSSDRPKPGRSTSARKSRSTSRLSTRRSQAKPASCCLRCST
jgi:hypothetical protein